MEGLQEHMKWQAQLAGAKMGGGGGGSGSFGGGGQRTIGTDNPDRLSDIGTMVPIEKVSGND